MDVFRSVSVCVFYQINVPIFSCLIMKKNAKVFFAVCTDQPVRPHNIYPLYDREFKEYLQGGAELLMGQVVQKSKW